MLLAGAEITLVFVPPNTGQIYVYIYIYYILYASRVYTDAVVRTQLAKFEFLRNIRFRG